MSSYLFAALLFASLKIAADCRRLISHGKTHETRQFRVASVSDVYELDIRLVDFQAVFDVQSRCFSKTARIVCFYRTQRTARKVLFLATSVCGSFLFVCEIYREPLNGFAPNSHGRRVRSLGRISLRVKVKSQRSRSPETKNGIFGSFGGMRAVYVW